jgi:hypothetical protein
MSFKNHSIFGPKKEEEHINKIFIKKNKKGEWSFEKNGQFYNMSPAEITKYSFSPIISGADKLINNACKIKNINSNKGMYLYFSEEEFIDCDVRMEFDEKLFDGWLYNIYSEKISVDKGQKAWACDYLKLYYKEPPKKVYLKLEKNS